MGENGLQLKHHPLICIFHDEDLTFNGYLVIDSTIRGKCCGGVRLSSKVTLNEVISLAKNMTLKYAFIGFPMGGAKTGICINEPLTKTKRKLVFTKLGKILSPLLISGSYIPGPDMGTSYEDIDWLLDSATRKQKNREHSPTSLYTSWTMFTSAKQALGKLNLKFKKSEIAIEGFGNIGTSAAKIFSENKTKLIAISTDKGAIHNSKGLNIVRLLELKEKYGDDVVNHYPDAEEISKEYLLCLPVDILLPCAGPWTINSKNVNKIKAKIICPGANIPITEEAEKKLFEQDILSIPDYVSNSGGVLGAFMGSMVTEQIKKEIIMEEFGKRVLNLMQTSQKKGIPPIEVANRIAMERYKKIKMKYEKPNLQTQLSNKIKSIKNICKKFFLKPRAKNIYIELLSN